MRTRAVLLRRRVGGAASSMDTPDDGDDEGGPETESATIKGSTNSLAGMADGAWGESEGEGEE